MLRVATASLLVLLSTLAGFTSAGPLIILSKADPARPSDTAGGLSQVAALSADGRYTVFLSDATNLLPGVTDTNHKNEYFPQGSDLFLHDRIDGTTVLISHAAGDPGTTANAQSLYASISAEGRWVAFTSYASNLVAGQVDPTASVFLYDRVTGANTLVAQGHCGADWPEISGDGGRIAYLCDGNAFLYDRATGTTTLVSHLAGSATAAGGVFELDFSADGNWVVFASDATGMVAGEVDNGAASDVYLYSHTTGEVVLVSHVPGAAATQADDMSFRPAVSDGGHVAFVSFAANLVTGQGGNDYTINVFLYDRATGANTLVSHTASSATTVGDEHSDKLAMSADGRYVAFTSKATNLIAGDPGWWEDIFLYDRTTGTNTLVSRSSASPGTPANESSWQPQISSDGSFVAFRSQATDLVPGQTDTPGSVDSFLWTRATGAVELVTHVDGSPSTAARGVAPSHHEEEIRISADGSWIALTSSAGDLVAGFDANTAGDVFVYERTTGEQTLLSARGGAASASAGSSVGFWTMRALSNDGRYSAFTSLAPNLALGATDANSASDIFLHDRIAGASALVSHATGSPDTSAAGSSYDPLISADGSTLLFVSYATDLVPGQVTTSSPQLFHYDRKSGAVALVSHAAGSPSATADAQSGESALSSDGRWVAYTSYATDAVAGQADTNLAPDVFLWDRATGESVLVSHASSSPTQAGDLDSSGSGISADGRYVVFASSASNLIPGQTGYGGLFLYDRIAGTNTRFAVQGGRPFISADGRWIAFESHLADLVPGQVDTNHDRDVFLWDRVTGTTVLASRTPASPTTAGNGLSLLQDHFSQGPVLSADGRWLVFQSRSTDLVAGQTESNSDTDVFLFDRAGGTLTLVSRSAGSPATTGNGRSGSAAISADGRFVGFSSAAGDLIPGQVNEYGGDYFLYDRTTGAMTLITHAPGSEVPSGGARQDPPQLSADGAWVVFESQSPDLVPGDLDALPDVFLHANPLGRDFFTVTPCRLMDTRQQGQALTSGIKRRIQVSGACGLPSTARAVAVNVTVVQPSGAGYLQLHPGDAAAPDTSTITFTAGAVRANNAILPLAFDGTGTLAATPVVAGGGTVHLVLDVSGWFE